MSTAEQWTLGIVGSRGVTDYEAVSGAASVMLALAPVARIVSGGQRGVDSLAKEVAERRGIQFAAFPASGRTREEFTAAAHARNQRIVDESDALVAVPCVHSKGTFNTIRRAAEKGIAIFTAAPQPCNCETRLTP